MAEVKTSDALQRRLALLTLHNAFSIITDPNHTLYSVFQDAQALSDLADAIQIHEDEDDELCHTKLGQLITNRPQTLHIWKRPPELAEDEPEEICIIYYTDSKGWKRYHVYDYTCRCEQCNTFDLNDDIGSLAVEIAHLIRCGWDLEGLEGELQDIKELMDKTVKKNKYERAGRWLCDTIAATPYGSSILNTIARMF